MILIDANLLLYAYDPSSPHHESSRAWLERVFHEQARVGLAWIGILAFVRILTHPRAVRPATLSVALSIVAEWLRFPSVVVLQPGDSHWMILNKIAAAAQASGAFIMDAHLAALAMEHGALLCTNDRGFRRFDGLRVQYPLELD